MCAFPTFMRSCQPSPQVAGVETGYFYCNAPLPLRGWSYPRGLSNQIHSTYSNCAAPLTHPSYLARRLRRRSEVDPSTVSTFHYRDSTPTDQTARRHRRPILPIQRQPANQVARVSQCFATLLPSIGCIYAI